MKRSPAGLGCRILPVGDAFENGRAATPPGNTPFPIRSSTPRAPPPTLPDQTHSLNRGYSWSGKSLKFDGHHANAAGEYLGAAVWFEFLFGHSVVGNFWYRPG